MTIIETIARSLLELPILKTKGATYDAGSVMISWKHDRESHRLSFYDEIAIWSCINNGQGITTIATFEYADPNFVPLLESMIGKWKGWPEFFRRLRLDGMKMRL